MTTTRIPDGPVDGRIVFIEGSSRPSPGTLWRWLRQGRPRDFPVILQVGQIEATAETVWGDSLEVGNIRITDWAFETSMLDGPVVLPLAVIAEGLLARYPVEVTMPDGNKILSWYQQT
jgi:hypothetical protein